MKNNIITHHSNGIAGNPSAPETSRSINVHSKRIHKPFTSSDMWFIQRSFKRRSVGEPVNFCL